MTDRLVGFKVSPVMWTKGLKGTSAGRVQSAALKFIADKEKEIRAFVKEEYWSITAKTSFNFDAEFYAINGESYTPKNEEETNKIVKEIKNPLIVSSYKRKTRTRRPPPPFVTSTMQQDAGGRYKWSSKKVMDTAQSLFSQGLITYHRTDSTRCDPDKIKDIREKIRKKLGEEYLSEKPINYGPKEEAQDAHEAIRPTFESIPPTIAPDERKLLNLITNRFMASQMAPAKFDQAKILLKHRGERILNFKASGSVLKFDGFLKIYGSSGDDVAIPEIKEGQGIDIEKIEPVQHFTKAPPRYTEPSFIKKMEKEGIGRPSTYASIIETLVHRNYVERKRNTIYGTEIGIMVCDYLDKFFNKLTHTEFTADMESKLDLVEAGKQDFVKVLEEFNDILDRDIINAKRKDSMQVFKSDVDCPSCNDGSKMVRKISDASVFLGCENWPKCGHTFNITEDGKLEASEVETGKACPSCGNKIRIRNGKWGKWASCEGYPSCTWKGSVDDEGNIVSQTEKKTTDLKCPKCEEHMLVHRKGKYGSFLGCEGYPICNFTAQIDKDGNIVVKSKKSRSKKEPKKTGETCPKCNKNELVEREGRYGVFIACSGFPKCKFIKK